MRNVGNHLFRIAKECRTSQEEGENIYLMLWLLCFRFLSENLRKTINKWMSEKGNVDFDYLYLSDEHANQYREDTISRIGYFLLPSHLYDNFCSSTHENILKDVSLIFRDVIDSSSTIYNHITIHPQEIFCRRSFGIFSKYFLPSNAVAYRNERTIELINKINGIPYEDLFENNETDIFDGLMKLKRSLLRRSLAEFYIPSYLSEFIAKLLVKEKNDINSVYDPFCGYGTLLSKIWKVSNNHHGLRLYGIDRNSEAVDLCWINLLLNGLMPNQFFIKNAEPLTDINPRKSNKYDAVATCYTKDLSIVDHILDHLNNDSVAAILTFPDVLYRNGPDKEIRNKLISKNLISAIIQLPSKTLPGNSIAPCILILSNKLKENNGVLFVNATEEYVTEGRSIISDENIKRIVELFSHPQDIPGLSKYVSREKIIENENSLNVSSYIKPEYTIESNHHSNGSRNWNRTYKFNNSTLTIQFGDITKSKAEVIVSSDDTEISMGGGVSQSILEAGGEFVKEDAQKKLPAMLGDVVVSTAGRLTNQKYIFHCLTIDYDRDISFYKEKLSGQTTMNDYIVSHCVEECFRLMQALNIKSIAFPLIGSGIAEINMNLVAKVMSESLANLLSLTSEPYQIELFLLDRFGEKKEFDYLGVFEFFGVQEKLIQRNQNYLFDDESEVIKEFEIPNMVQDYPVFISFSDSDWDIVKKLILQVLNKEGIECFAYKKENYAGANYQDKIIHAINHAKVVIFACSNKSLASGEVRDELFYSKSRKKLIIPVKLDSSSTDWYDYNFMPIDYIDPKHMPNAIQKLIKRVKFEINRSTVIKE